MTKPTAFALGITLGALALPLGYNLGCRLAGRHHLAIKEN